MTDLENQIAQADSDLKTAIGEAADRVNTKLDAFAKNLQSGISQDAALTAIAAIRDDISLIAKIGADAQVAAPAPSGDGTGATTAPGDEQPAGGSQ